MLVRVTNDISTFMTWFVSSVVDMFSELFSILDSITFAGTSLLRVMLTLLILGSLIGVILTIGQSFNVLGNRSERIISKEEAAQRRKERSNKK